MRLVPIAVAAIVALPSIGAAAARQDPSNHFQVSFDGAAPVLFSEVNG